MVLPIAAAYASLTGISGIVAFLAMFITMAFIIDRNEREHPEARPLRHPLDDTIALMKEEVEKEKEKPGGCKILSTNCWVDYTTTKRNINYWSMK